MTVAIYARISADREDRQVGVKDQIKRCRSLCEAEGWEVAGEPYADNNRTAADPNKPRPAYDRMMRAIAAGGIDRVVVHTEDRLHRQPAELETFISTAERVGLRWVESVKGGTTNLDDPDAVMLLRFKGSMGAREIAVMRGRMVNRQTDMAERGVSKGGGQRAFGWNRGSESRDGGTRDGTVQVPEEAPYIAEAARRVLDGEPLRKIVREWNAAGTPKTVTGRPWSVTALRTILISPRNAGLRQYLPTKTQRQIDDEPTAALRRKMRAERMKLRPAAWPAIIDPADREELVRRFEHPDRLQGRPDRRAYALRGVLRCVNCGALLVSTPRSRPGGRIVRYYQCRAGAPGMNSHPGIRVAIPADEAEDQIFRLVRLYADNPAVRGMAATEDVADAAEVKRLLGENAADRQQIAEWEDAFTAGDLSRNGLQRAKVPAEARIAQRTARIAELQGTTTLARFAGNVSEHWDDLDTDEQRMIALSLLSSVDLHPASVTPRLRFHWRYAALAEWAEAHPPAGGDDAEAEALAAGNAAVAPAIRCAYER